MSVWNFTLTVWAHFKTAFFILTAMGKAFFCIENGNFESALKETSL
jgi:hypothetical protein